MSLRGAFEIVKDFEEALCEYTGAPHAVAVDSCTNALFLSLLCYREKNPEIPGVMLPCHTYVGVAHAARNAGFEVGFWDKEWIGLYEIPPFPLWDSAKFFERDMYVPQSVMCVSFHVAKRLPLGHGGAILTDDADIDRWLRRARFDGRSSGETGENATKITVPGHHMYMTPDDAARGLWLLQQYVDQPLNPEWSNYPDISKLFEGGK